MSSDEEKLAAYLDEDEAAAKYIEDHSEPWRGRWEADENHRLRTYNGWTLAVPGTPDGEFAPGVLAHIARHDPARVLREVEAVRAIIRESSGEGHGWAEHEPSYYAGLGYAVTLLAAIYED